MKRFLRKLILYILILILIFGVFVLADFLFIGNQYEKNYQASLLDKVWKIKNTNEPKIIIVGNSNVAFGFRSNLIEEELGMPVINAGVHAALGNRVLENVAKRYACPGDIVVICHSDYSDDDKIMDPGLALITLEWNKELWDLLDIKDIPDIISAVPNYLRSAFLLKIRNQGNQSTGDCYSRDAFNEYGDNVFADDSAFTFMFTDGCLEGFVPQISDTCITRLNELNDYLENRGAKMVVAGFPIADGEFSEDHLVFESFETELKSKLSCEVISSVDDYYFDYDYFYNTPLHLTGEGAIIRTNQLIEDLKNYLGDNR